MNWKSELIRSRTGRFCLGKMAEFYDRWICTPEAVRGQAAKGCSPGNGLRFSVGIPHYNRGGLIYRPLFNLLDHPAVAEVVIVDDGSREEEYRALLRFVDSLGCGGRIRVIRRVNNRGALFTKLECVDQCKSEWVLVLDSDNTAFRGFLNALTSLKEPEFLSFYCASWAWPFFSFHELQGAKIDFDRVCQLSRLETLKRAYFINDGNFLVHRVTHMKKLIEIRNYKVDAADVMFLNYKWLSDGGNLILISNSSYFHRLDCQSFWKRTAEKSKKNVKDIFARFDLGIRWEKNFLQ